MKYPRLLVDNKVRTLTHFSGIAGGVVSQPYFEAHFGLVTPDGAIDKEKDIQVSSNVVSVLQAGAFFGAVGSPPVSSWLGRRWALVAFTVVLTTVAGGSRGIGYIYGGRIVSGIGVGGISAIAPAYVAECAPKNVRGRMIGLFQAMIAVGVMVSYFVNLGVGLHLGNSEMVWRVPFGLQLVPAGLMCIGLLTVKESPRWLASKGLVKEAIRNLAYFRKASYDSLAVQHEMAEIEAAIQEEKEGRSGVGLHQAFFGKGNFVRFVIAFTIFVFQQWSGQNSVGYYAPQIFSSIGYMGTKASLLASGIYGIMKVLATMAFIFFAVETLGRKLSLFISAIGMGVMFFIVGAILKVYPVNDVSPGQQPSQASQAMAAMLYVYVCFYSLGVGPLPWVYVSDIFPTRTRHYGLAVASGTQWLFNFVVSKVTPTLIADLGYKLFFMFAVIDICGIATFATLIPETKGRSLEEMDIIFGAVSNETRKAFIERQERQLQHELNEMTPEGSHQIKL
ncbi:hypothetical protein ID866_3007 [Astraeus odoratus]|nr:hypothetical protein ID866_3007 [Astraeus odoratus]